MRIGRDKILVLGMIGILLSSCSDSKERSDDLATAPYRALTDLLDSTPSMIWYSQPLPDSMYLLGYQGRRLICRLENLPADCRYLAGFDVVTKDKTENVLSQGSKDLSSGAGLFRNGDLVYDIFWKEPQGTRCELNYRVMIIERQSNGALFIWNEGAIQRDSFEIPDQFRNNKSLRTKAAYGLRIDLDKAQQVMSLRFLRDGSASSEAGPYIELQWYFMLGVPESR